MILARSISDASWGGYWQGLYSYGKFVSWPNYDYSVDMVNRFVIEKGQIQQYCIYWLWILNVPFRILAKGNRKIWQRIWIVNFCNLQKVTRPFLTEYTLHKFKKICWHLNLHLDFKHTNISLKIHECLTVKIWLSSDFLLQFSQKPLKCLHRVDCVALQPSHVFMKSSNHENVSDNILLSTIPSIFDLCLCLIL